VGDSSRSLPKIILAGDSFQISKTSTRNAESESDRQDVVSESARGIESALGIEFTRGAESESNRQGVKSKSNHRGVECESV